MNHLWSSVAGLFIGRVRRRPDRAGRRPPRATRPRRDTASCGSSRARRRSTSARSTSASRTTRRTPPLTAQRSEEALDLLQDVLAIELLMAATVAVGVPTGRALPAPIAAAFDATRRVREPLGRPARAAAVHAAVSAAAVRRHPRGGAGRGRPGAMTAGVAGAPTTSAAPAPWWRSRCSRPSRPTSTSRSSTSRCR